MSAVVSKNYLPRIRALRYALRHRVAQPLTWSRKYRRRFEHDPQGYQWWLSADEENYQGPYGTRDEALAAALREGTGEAFNGVDGCQRFWMCEARQGPVHLHRYVDADDVLQRVCERIDDELGGEDGMDWDFWSEDAELDLDRQLRVLVRRWQRKHKITVRTWGFTHVRGTERYTHVWRETA